MCVSLLFSSGNFIQKEALNSRAALVVVVTGSIGVFIAAFIVKSLDVEMLSWLVSFVVLYTAITMLRSWQQGRKEALIDSNA